MIRVRKQIQPPPHLEQNAERARVQICGDPSKAGFDATVYRHITVVEELKRAHFSKCCYCESPAPYGDVEHYRPKAHYYWLAYQWDNLLWACPSCNRHKGDSFPLEYPSAQCRTEHDPLHAEAPLLIHPAEEDPETSIEWQDCKPIAVDGNERGLRTIKLMKLDEEPWLDRRRRCLNEFRRLWRAWRVAERTGAPTASSLGVLIKEYQQDSHEFAAMYRTAARRLELLESHASITDMRP